MFASKNIPVFLIFLILLSVFVYATHLQAEQPGIMDPAELNQVGHPPSEETLALANEQEALVERALESARDLDYEMAESWLQKAAAVREDQGPVDKAYLELAVLKQEHATQLQRKAVAAMEAGNFSLADFYIIDLIALGEQQDRVDSLRVRLEEARLYGGFRSGQIISDKLLKSGGNAPELVIINAGSFLMGSREHAEGVRDHEKPRHRVTFQQGFALGTKEVSVAEFRLFIDGGGYQTTAERTGSSSVYDERAGRLSDRNGINWRHDYLGRKADPDLPVLHVSFHDAHAYVRWLSEETGKTYRLPSEAEYEYVARAGGKGSYWWGEGSPSEAVENLTGEDDSSSSNRKWTTYFKEYGDSHWGPAATGSLASDNLSHPMGIHDIAGNVSEWTGDCWHENYFRAPVDGSAWINPGCNRRVVRGGYWASSPAQCRAAFRLSAKAETHGPVVGIRVARDL